MFQESCSVVTRWLHHQEVAWVCMGIKYISMSNVLEWHLYWGRKTAWALGTPSPAFDFVQNHEKYSPSMIAKDSLLILTLRCFRRKVSQNLTNQKANNTTTHIQNKQEIRMSPSSKPTTPATTFPMTCDESVMKQKSHGTSETPVQSNLRWGCDVETADRICNFNRHYAGRWPCGFVMVCRFFSSYFCKAALTMHHFFLTRSSSSSFNIPHDDDTRTLWLFWDQDQLCQECQGGGRTRILWFQYWQASFHGTSWTDHGRIPQGKSSPWMALLSRWWSELGKCSMSSQWRIGVTGWNPFGTQLARQKGQSLLHQFGFDCWQSQVRKNYDRNIEGRSQPRQAFFLSQQYPWSDRVIAACELIATTQG